MQRTMGNYKSTSKFLAIAILLTITLATCWRRGYIEPKLDLQLKKQAIEEPFTFAKYCENVYDSIYIIQPYENRDVIDSLPYKMSGRLRGTCSYTGDDTHTRIIFIDNDTVKAYTEIPAIDAYFSTTDIVKNGPQFPFEQKFIMDKNRDVHIYNE